MRHNVSRRWLLTTAATIGTLGTSGCLRLLRGGSGNPRNAEFEFVREGDTLVIRHAGGGSVPAENLEIWSSRGVRVAWPKLGSTTSGAADDVSEGSVARIDGSVINWPHDITSSDTIRVVYIGEEGSPTTLGVWQCGTEGTTNSTATGDQTTTADSAVGTRIVSESFEGTSWQSDWEYSGITEADSHLVLSSDGRLRYKPALTSSGTLRIRSVFKPRNPDYNQYNAGISFLGDHGNFVRWQEHPWFGKLRLKMWHKQGESQSRSLAEPNGTKKRTYEIDINLDEKTVTRVQRDDQEWQTNLSIESIYRDEFRIFVARETTDTGVEIELHELSARRI